MLNIMELGELENQLKDSLQENLLSILTKLNREGKLTDFLSLIDYQRLLPKESSFISSNYNYYTTGKIVVIGDTQVKEEHFKGIAKSLGINDDRLELHLSYDFLKKNSIKKFEYSDRYSVILIGPVAHKGKDMGEYSSVISSMESQKDAYPPVIRLGQSQLKITKENFKNTLRELLQEGIIKRD